MAKKRKKAKSQAVAVRAAGSQPWKASSPPVRPTPGLQFKPHDHGPIKSVTTEADGSQHIEFHYPVK
jgi:hypothetical protein